MASWDDVRALALSHEGASEVISRGSAAWRTTRRQFVWERPVRARELEELGDRAPSGPVVAILVDDESTKHALVSGDPEIFFTTAHFDGYAIVLARLDALDRSRLAELIAEAYEEAR